MLDNNEWINLHMYVYVALNINTEPNRIATYICTCKCTDVHM